MGLDIEGLYNVHTLQESKNVEDQKRLIKLIKTLSSDEGWPVCTSLLLGNDTSLPDISLLPEEQKSSIIFVCCRAVEELLKSGIPVVAGEVEKFGSFLWGWLKVLSGTMSTSRHQKYIKTKAGQIICLVVLRYFPKYWPSFFDELIFFLSEVSDKGGIGSPLPESVLVAIDLFLDTLINLDPYLVSRDVQLTTEETALGNEVKDGMRVSSVPALLSSCYEMARVLYAPNLIYAAYLKKVLTAVGLMASWVDLCLVGSAEWINLSVSLLQASYECFPSGATVRAGVYAYFFGLVSKGMPNSEKLDLINELWNRISNLLPGEPSIAHSNGVADPGDEQSEASYGYALFINEVGQKLIDICRDTPQSVTNGNAASNDSLRSVALASLEGKLDIAISILSHEEEQVSRAVIPCLRSYISLFKSSMAYPGQTAGRRSRNRNSSTLGDSSSPGGPVNGNCDQTGCFLELNESRMCLLKRLLFALITKLKSLPLQESEDSDEEEDAEYRRDLRTLVCNLIQLDAGFVLDVINQLIKHAAALLSTAHEQHPMPAFTLEQLADIDVSLSLFYLFGESCKAPKSDHFSPNFPLRPTMVEIMGTLCTDSFASLPHCVLQLNYFEVMARYERYFTSAPNHLFLVMLAFVDNRGLHSPWRPVRLRCAYLITRLIKAHKKILLPHTEQLLTQFADLLNLSLEFDKTRSANDVNGTKDHQDSLLGITEQSFLYEAAAQLIAAGGIISIPEDPTIDRMGQLFRMLLNPVLGQYSRLVDAYSREKDPKLAEAQGNLLKHSADLITRTSRVFSQPKSVLTLGCQQVLCDVLQIMVGGLDRFSAHDSSPGRIAAFAGVRAFLHRMVACIGPSTSEGTGNDPISDLVLVALAQAVPRLVQPLHSSVQNSTNHWGNGTSSVISPTDPEQRWREIRDTIPLISQVISRYKDRCASFLSACLPELLTVTTDALSEAMALDNLGLVEERKLLRRGYLQLLQTICQSLPSAFFEHFNSRSIQNVSTILAEIEACIDSNDPVGLRSGLSLFGQLILYEGHDSQFYQGFLLPHLVPFCILSPTRKTFYLMDLQFSLALDESSSCLYQLAQKQPDLPVYLADVFLPKQHLSPELIKSYVCALRSENIKDFQSFIQKFYWALR